LLDKPLVEEANAYHLPGKKTAEIIPRANVAKFMLDEMVNKKYVQKGVAIDVSK
jgi:hypothetical protein